MQNNPLFAFVSELFLRLGTKSPKFFIVIQWISAILVALTGLPQFLEMLGVKLGAPWNALENKIVAVASATAFVISMLPTQNNAVSKDSTGLPLKKTDAKMLPFTAMDEIKNAKV